MTYPTLGLNLATNVIELGRCNKTETDNNNVITFHGFIVGTNEKRRSSLTYVHP